MEINKIEINGVIYDICAAELAAVNKAITAEAAARTEKDSALQQNLDTTSAKLQSLIGEDSAKTARTIAAEELAKQLVPENAQESLDTLSELAAWIQEHPEDTAAMNSRIAELGSALTAESEARAATDETLQKAITAETEARAAAMLEVTEAQEQAAENTNNSISTEIAARKEADSQLVEAIATETAARKEAIATEKTEREAATTETREMITAEGKTRVSAVETLTAALAAEAKARAENDAAETKARTDAIEAIAADVEKEAETRAEAVTALQQTLTDEVTQRQIDTETLTQAIADEAAARTEYATSVEAANAETFSAIRETIAAETTERKTADTALQKAIDATTDKVLGLIGEDTEKTARQIAAEELAKQLIPENAQESLDTLSELAAWIQEHPEDTAAINSKIAELTANLTAEAKARADADNAAAEALADETAARADADSTLQKAIDNEAAARTEAIEAEAAARTEAITATGYTAIAEELAALKAAFESYNPFPIGYVYPQLSGQLEPAKLFAGTWENISASYKGVFFRVEGGNSAPFGELQADAIKSHSHDLDTRTWTYSPTATQTEDGFNFNFGGYTGANKKTEETGSNETRPVNYAMRLWQRTA